MPADPGLFEFKTVGIEVLIDSYKWLAWNFQSEYLKFLRGGGLQKGLRVNSHDLIWIMPAKEEGN